MVRLSPRDLAVPFVVLVVGVAATGLVSGSMNRTVARQDEERFGVAVDRLDDSIRDRMELYMSMLRAGAGLFAAAEVRTPAQFHELSAGCSCSSGIGASRGSATRSAFATPSSSRRSPASARRVQQVAWNLLADAITFTPAGGRVEVQLRHDGTAVALAVAVNGIGIDPPFLPPVFDRFRQADGSSTRGHGGLGIGRSIVRGLVEIQGGTVHAASSGPRQGPTFTVLLPQASATATGATAVPVDAAISSGIERSS